METFDIIIVGAGMAGASVAAELCDGNRVLLLEREEQPGYHATGRSAAAYIPSYGADNLALHYLTACSRSILQEPPSVFRVPTLLHQRGLLSLCTPAQKAQASVDFDRLRATFAGIAQVDTAFIRHSIPLIRDEYASSGWFEPDVHDIDVHALHEGYLRILRQHGGRLVNNAEAVAIERRQQCWQVQTRDTVYSAPLLVNAAGAWADQVARLAGVNPIGLMPLRRTAVLLQPPPGCEVSGWPLIMATDGSFYLKPDAGLILASPADEHLSEACDARPEELDVAYAVHYAQAALRLEVRRVEHSWAGLRSFVADRSPVLGYANDVDGFFWLAGQGGHGIQMAPATARLAAAQIAGSGIPADLAALGFDPAWVAPGRL
ncbi:NAD(P)/FAD-dependent oxidoreductase [Parahaliea mediterranea]|uniref:NAD(P)/FAD-dependent oxidoreductase n=1 Tax=Parahaliea mediterranea TaxID=651086 RepID=UPI001F4D6070|nr:FAD-binding oxidoreductase [Parahaliea mediterranea]